MALLANAGSFSITANVVHPDSLAYTATVFAGRLLAAVVCHALMWEEGTPDSEKPCVNAFHLNFRVHPVWRAAEHLRSRCMLGWVLSGPSMSCDVIFGIRFRPVLNQGHGHGSSARDAKCGPQIVQCLKRHARQTKRHLRAWQHAYWYNLPTSHRIDRIQQRQCGLGKMTRPYDTTHSLRRAGRNDATVYRML